MNKTKGPNAAQSKNRQGTSPPGKISTTSVTLTEPKKQKLTIWPEWNENDVNNEKWDVGGKARDSKSKPTSAPGSHGFEDPDPKFEWPASIQSRIRNFKRPSELFDKTPVIVDAENGMENFDLISSNEHLHKSETIRWIISQIHSLWDACKKEPKTTTATTTGTPTVLDGEQLSNKAFAAGRLWRPWEHIYAINKLTKGPFIPVYNPSGKYAVRLFFMGAWRKLIIDDMIPVDEDGIPLLPQTTIYAELWPLLLTKALLKIVSLDFNPPDSPTEFNDANVVSCLTGWLPEPLPLRFGHISEVWKFLKETLPKYQWPDDKPKTSTADEELNIIPENAEIKEDVSVDKDTGSKSEIKNRKSKESKSIGGNTSKLEKHKATKPDKRGKSVIDENVPEENYAPDFPEMVVFASFTDLPMNKLSASSETADRRERLRKYNLNHDFSNPFWATCTRDIPINPPPPPVKIPVWKTIRHKKKNNIPSDEPIYPELAKPDQWIELKSPYVGYKAQKMLPIASTVRTSKFNKIVSKGQTGISVGIEESEEIDRESPTDLQAIRLDIAAPSEKPESEPSDGKSKTKVNTPPGSVPAPPTNGSAAPVKSSSSLKKEREKSIDLIEKSAAPSISSGKDNASQSAAHAKIKLNKENSVSSESKQTNVNKSIDEESKMSKVPKGTEKQAGPAPLTQENLGLANSINLEPASGSTNNAEVKSPPQHEQRNSAEVRSKLWMDIDDFFVCFKSIIVYHKPSSYKYCEKATELKQVTQHLKPEKKRDANSQQQASIVNDDKAPKFLFADSLSPIEIMVSFASLSRWYETKSELPEKQSKPKATKEKSESFLSDHDLLSLNENVKEVTPLVPGYLMAEPYSWKSLVVGQPLLRMHTTAIRSAFLSLPPGRHVLKFMINAPIGYHLNIVSNIKFALGDEEEIMPKLTDESCRFIDQATQIIKALGEAIKNFKDPGRQRPTLEQVYTSISPLTDAYLQADEKLTRRHLIEVFNLAVYEMLKKALGEQADAHIAYAWKVFLNDYINTDVLSLRDKRPETSSTLRSSAKKIEKKRSEMSTTGKDAKAEKADKQATAAAAAAAALEKAEKVEKESWEEKVEVWKTLASGAPENLRITVVQKLWRGLYCRLVRRARIPETKENLKIFESLKKAWTIVEANEQDNALFLFRNMFKQDPALAKYYAFYKDEWNKISYTDYNGTYNDQVSNSWFILFRDIFHANEPVLVQPKLYCNLSNHILRVINNDTYQEVPKVFNKVSSYTYTKNRRGYTIIAEARIFDQPVNSGRWRLRLIGNTSPLITPRGSKTEIVSSFETKEAREYYIPNENKTIMRYKVTVQEDNLATLQITTSKPDVYIKFSVYDQGEEMVSVIGKGTAIIPAFIFHKDRLDNTADTSLLSRPGSIKANTNRVSKAASNTSLDAKPKDPKGAKRSSSANSNEVKDKDKDTKVHSRSSSRQSLGGDDDDDQINKVHKYIVEASVLKDSWPLTPSNWAFVNTLRESEIADLRINRDRANSPSKEAKASSVEGRGGAGAKPKQQSKDKPKGKGSSNAGISRPTSSGVDVSKPHWTLKWAVDANSVDFIEIRKDTDRVEEIKALKRAWESQMPGRAAKAINAREKFLKSHMVKVDGVTDDEIEPAVEDAQAQTGAAQGAAPSQTAQTAKTTTDSKSTAAGSKKQTGEDSKASTATSKGGAKQKKDKEKDKEKEKASQETPPIDQAPVDAVVVEEPLSTRPPTPPKPKLYLPTFDVTPFAKSVHRGVVLKDESFQQQQDILRRAQLKDFVDYKNEIMKFREEERKYRLYQKLKQIEEYEALQIKLDESRKQVYDPREAFRQIFLDAERKRLEELARQESLLVAQKPEAKDKKGKTSPKGKKGKK